MASRLDYMEFAMQATTEWKRGHIWDILAAVQPHSFGLGISAPTPCFRVLFGKVQQCCISRDQTTGDLKSHHLQAGVTALSVSPSPPFFQQFMKKSFFFFFKGARHFFKGTHGLFGGHVPLRPPSWVRHCKCMYEGLSRSSWTNVKKLTIIIGFV